MRERDKGMDGGDGNEAAVEEEGDDGGCCNMSSHC